MIGSGMLGAWSGDLVPGFDKQRLKQLPAADIRHVLQDRRMDILKIGMRPKYDHPHTFSRKMQEDAFDWLDRRLKP